jgi:hypothetical protein
MFEDLIIPRMNAVLLERWDAELKFITEDGDRPRTKWLSSIIFTNFSGR